MLANAICERHPLVTMTGVVLLGDTDLSLGIQDQLKCGNKVRVLPAGPAPLPLVVSLCIDQTSEQKAVFNTTLLLQISQCQPQAGEGDTGPIVQPVGRGPRKLSASSNIVGRCPSLPAALVWPPHACPVSDACLGALLSCHNSASQREKERKVVAA